MRAWIERSLVPCVATGTMSDGWQRNWGGAKDDDVLGAAVGDARILITEDKDFGELVYRRRLHHRGVVLVRVDGISPPAG